jgi:signal transduction histidine kinase
LRTPLTSIMGYLELLMDEDEGNLTDEGRHHLEVIRRNADRLMRLVGDILLVAQVQAGTFTVTAEVVDVETVVAHSVEAAMPIAEEKEIALNVHNVPVPPIEGDRGRLAQLLDNLISNALKFTPAGERIDVRSSTSDGAIVVEVENTGSYLPPEEQEHLFDRFFRASGAIRQAISGVGLGLSICKAIAEAHGGTISVRSEKDVSTTFSVRLPVPELDESRATDYQHQGATA